MSRELTDDDIFAFAFLQGVEMETKFLPDGRCVMQTRYPVAVQEVEPGRFVVSVFKDLQK